MIEAVISALIYICVLALVVYLVIWVVTEVLGVPIPAKVIQILWIIVALIVLLILIRMLPIPKLAKVDVTDPSGNVVMVKDQSRHPLDRPAF